ncbi:MAG: radical SAM family heme chaperone HemW [Bacteroidetes bacterium]|nr:radical SAM family heme chaperone HemW [Bacteroidota bacterium]
MAGIYIHIPFCRKACYYCNFHFSVSQQLLPQMVNAIAKEAVLRSSLISENISTIYFGGGTPSLLSGSDLLLIMDSLHTVFNVDAGAEITLEANPDDINNENLSTWKQAGINRLSIGAQSFFNDELQWMNRAHNAGQAYTGIELAKQNGFENITIDFIYGTPHLTDEKWLTNLNMAKTLNVPHLSCYALTVESKTALYKMIEQKKKENIDADKQGRQFEILMDWARDNDYEHYEISNFAQPGFRSRHNSSYWQGKPYLGLGPSAHSYNGISRQWNIANNTLYIKSINENIVPFEIEMLTPVQLINEYIMTALRTSEGISLQQLLQLSNQKTIENIIEDAQKFIRQNLMLQQSDTLILTKKGKLFADGIASDLFRL